jgi:Flp pilus assembly protein TadD
MMGAGDMFTNFKVRNAASFSLTVLLLLSGCQTFNNWKNNSYQSKNQPPSGLNDSQFTADVKPEQKVNVQMAIAHALESQGESQQAINMYLDVVKQDPRRAEAYHRLAVLHDKIGDVKEARMYYQIAVKKDPKNAELYCDYGYSYYLQRDWSKAENNLRHAIALNKQCTRAHTNLGLVLARSNRSKEALMEFTKAGCDEATARCNVAFAMKLERRWPEARKQYELALAANPRSTMAREGMATLPPRKSGMQPAENVRQEPIQRIPQEAVQSGNGAAQRVAVSDGNAQAPTIQASWDKALAPENLSDNGLAR